MTHILIRGVVDTRTDVRLVVTAVLTMGTAVRQAGDAGALGKIAQGPGIARNSAGNVAQQSALRTSRELECD